MKKILALLIVLFSMKVSIGQKIEPDSIIRNSVEEQAKKMGDLLLKKDFKEFAKFTHPKIIEMLGGEDKMVETIKKSFEDIEKGGVILTNIQIGKSSNFVTVDNELQCIINETIEMKIPNGKMTSNSSLIGISSNAGKSWYFIDTNGKDVTKFKDILPNLSEDLIIPESEPPTIIKD